MIEAPPIPTTRFEYLVVPLKEAKGVKKHGVERAASRSVQAADERLCSSLLIGTARMEPEVRDIRVPAPIQAAREIDGRIVAEVGRRRTNGRETVDVVDGGSGHLRRPSGGWSRENDESRDGYESRDGAHS